MSGFVNGAVPAGHEAKIHNNHSNPNITNSFHEKGAHGFEKPNDPAFMNVKKHLKAVFFKRKVVSDNNQKNQLKIGRHKTNL